MAHTAYSARCGCKIAAAGDCAYTQKKVLATVQSGVLQEKGGGRGVWAGPASSDGRERRDGFLGGSLAVGVPPKQGCERIDEKKKMAARGLGD